MRSVTASLFQFLLFTAAISFSFCDGNSNVLCIQSEREALLKFKNDLIDPSNRLSSWVEGGDCCKWNGVVCHNLTGHVDQLHLAAPLSSPDILAPFAEWEAYERSTLGGQINPSLLELQHLSWLDLSNNDFSSIQIPEFFGLIGSLTYLNLSQAQFRGAIPDNFGNLSKLQHLDVRGDYFRHRWDIKAKSLQWISELSSLQYLDLSFVDLREASDWLQVTYNLPSLLELHLSGCGLVSDPSNLSVNSTKSLAVVDLSRNHLSSVPIWIFSLHGLVSLDLSINYMPGPIPDYFGNISFLEVLDLGLISPNSSIPNSLYSLKHLKSLSLRNNDFQGEMSSSFGNLSSLIYLDLSYNKLQGKLPSSFGELCKLMEMDLSSNRIDQDISDILHTLSKCCLDCLELLYMPDNQLSGHLTDQLGQFKNLARLSLARNNISGPIPLSIGELSSLKVFDVSENQLNGTFPPSFGRLKNLEYLIFEHNKLEGVVSETHFFNLTKLTTLMASGNMLRFKPDSSWIPPFQCETIQLGQWQLGPKFPQWLKFQKNLSALDISHAGISDVVSTWFWNLSTQFQIVNLSSNQLTGGISYLNVGVIVDLSSNRFTGQLPVVLRPLGYLSLSRNLFSGSLSEFVCNSSMTSMQVLYIDANLLSGEIPDCWNHWQKLEHLNLGNNNLTGKIPSSLGYANLVVLNLRNNSLFGELPSTLQNSTSLAVLDLSENQFCKGVPAWIGDKLSGLEVLSLRSNNFDGHIPHKICALQSLQNLDLAHNNISGSIPTCFNNFSAMATKNKSFKSWIFNANTFYFSASLVLKGRQDEYSTTLGLVTSVEFSHNRLTGEIPKAFGSLVGLRSLNLSWNLLTGKIPDNIGKMELMESLDLSMNRLNGGIPSSLSSLNFLNHFNVSYNNLTGHIPTSTQLQSFENSSYMANHLCGPPVSKSCSTEGLPTDATNSRRRKVNGFYVSMIAGFVMGFWGVVAPLFFIRSWRHTYYGKLDQVGSKLNVFWATVGR
ncbi:hypothetical protein V6N13_088371 [Hibiscus sabdariffa]|uniref:Leucine-rich repeat-containing N-terminal plant-type domain-containing protein n=1 Tax=Hibiscus sabdariffa TaxID=183260 RepID=A0ABR2FZ53_9ROSI